MKRRDEVKRREVMKRRAERRAKREAKKEVGKLWFLHHRCRRVAVSRLIASKEEVARARTRPARQQALKKHWVCWEELRAVEQELSGHWEGDTFSSHRKRRHKAREAEEQSAAQAACAWVAVTSREKYSLVA